MTRSMESPRRGIFEVATSSSMTVFGFEAVIVHEGERATVQAKLKDGVELFRARQLIVNGGRYFMIHDFKIGKDSQFAHPGAIPAAVFGPETLGGSLEVQDLLPDLLATLFVEHVKVKRPNWLVRVIRKWLWLEDDWAAFHTFSAVLLGEAVMRDGYVPPSVAADGDGDVLSTIGGAVQ